MFKSILTHSKHAINVRYYSWESLGQQEIKLVNLKVNQLWIHFWKDMQSWSFNTLATLCQQQTHWKRSWCWERLKAEGEEGVRRWDDWMTAPSQWTWSWEILRDGEGQGCLACCNAWGHKESDMPWQLNKEQQQQITIIINPMEGRIIQLLGASEEPETVLVLSSFAFPIALLPLELLYLVV